MCLEEKKKFTKRRAYSSLENNAIHVKKATKSTKSGQRPEESDFAHQWGRGRRRWGGWGAY
jgi:hypothetical protein